MISVIVHHLILTLTNSLLALLIGDLFKIMRKPKMSGGQTLNSIRSPKEHYLLVLRE